MTEAPPETLGAAAGHGALYRLLAWLSPSFPVGAYTYSHGLEWAVEDGTVTDAASLRAWIADVLRHGSGRTDAILLAQAHAAFDAGDLGACRDIAELAAALQPSRERHLEATAQGAAFLAALEAAWPPQDRAAADRLAALQGRSLDRRTPHAAVETWTYAVAVGVACAAHGIARDAAVPAFLHAFAANLVSAAVRAVPLGQSDGQRVTAALEPVVAGVAADALTAPLDDLGAAALRADIASMRHETQYTRLFRS